MFDNIAKIGIAMGYSEKNMDTFEAAINKVKDADHLFEDEIQVPQHLSIKAGQKLLAQIKKQKEEYVGRFTEALQNQKFAELNET